MGIPSTMRDEWANRRNSLLIASPLEDQKILRSRQCTQEKSDLRNLKYSLRKQLLYTCAISQTRRNNLFDFFLPSLTHDQWQYHALAFRPAHYQPLDVGISRVATEISEPSVLSTISKGVRAGVKAASIACVATAVPTLVAVRVLPWAKANLNYTAQALIISAESVREGLKSAAIACVLTAVPTFAAVRTIPWAKANLNYTGQALIISGASIASYFITADKTILKAAKKNARYERKD
ncbi:hypothetical protein RHSIM_Rhsim04G0235000 [Rhododendron simsii]|uniref:Early nodulin-93 n=1 Tax=Rhododendron simsii TaxID=118357 RepID=A0A834H380_RHOSS|nr:hypothetical protein RHSIM_Rhsim04G0235000 [Rhododendron simsii]